MSKGPLMAGAANRFMRCEKCKWWDESDPGIEWRSCQLTEITEGRRHHPSSLALARGEGYDYEDEEIAWLKTHRTFGCVQWEDRRNA